MNYTIRSSALIGVVDLLHSLSVNPHVIFSKVGLSITASDTPDKKISYIKFLNLLNEAVLATGREDFGLLLSRYQGFNKLGAIGFSMKEAPNIRTAITNLCQFHHIHLNGAKSYLEEEKGLAIWGYKITVPSPPNYKQQLDLAMGIGIRLLRHFISQQWNPEFIHLEYKKPPNYISQQRAFRCPISYDQEINALIFDAKFLDQKIKTSNNDLHLILQDYLEQKAANSPNDFIEIVRVNIMESLQKGECSIDHIAATVYLTRRTFQRRLRTKGLNFKKLTEEVRLDMAIRLLNQSNTSLTQISDMLGYSELAAFSRSFKRVTGQSPRQWRNNSNPKTVL